MFIQTEDTPNPETIKFIPGQPVMPKGIIEFDAAEKAMKSPLAKQIFTVKGVSSVFLAGDFVSVTKEEDASWMILKPKILATIMDHYMSGMPVIEEGVLSGIDEQDNSKNADMLNEIEKQIVELIDTRVRPAVAQDGGDIDFERFEDGVVYLRMRGACAGCPSSTATLKMGIENMLKHFVPEVQEVQQST